MIQPRFAIRIISLIFCLFNYVVAQQFKASDTVESLKFHPEATAAQIQEPEIVHLHAPNQTLHIEQALEVAQELRDLDKQLEIPAVKAADKVEIAALTSDAGTAEAPSLGEEIEFAQALEVAQELHKLDQQLEVPLPVPTTSRNAKEKMVHFNYNNEDLTKVINDYAKEKNINIMLPQGVASIPQKVTIKFPGKIPLSLAESYLNYILDIAGYAMYPNDSFYAIKKTENNITREPLPLYINVPTSELPVGQRIRAIYYLANFKVPENPGGNEPLNLIIKDQLTPTGVYQFDPKSNGIILMDRSDIIAALMEIILRLDASGSKEIIRVVPLYNSVARNVADVIKNNLLTADSKGVVRSDIKSESGLYFSTSTRIVADDRMNSLILMGRETAIERLREFIQEYMDAPPESGRSILHVYDLQYLDAESFAPVLTEIVASRGIGTGQAGAAAGVTGPQQYFEGVKIVPETYKAASAAKTLPGTAATAAPETQQEGDVFRGGNRLIVTALHKDWTRIKELIQELDKPQLQVILEVMVVDLTLVDNKVLESQLRNPSGLQLPPGFNFQAAHITGVLTDQTDTTPPTTVAADLLRLLLGQTVSIATSKTSGINNGSTILSAADNNGSGVWLLLDLLSSYAETKVLTHPFMVTLNNVKAQTIVSDIRRAVGDQSVGEGAISTIKQDDVKAEMNLSITPRISSHERVNLQIAIEITDFEVAQDVSTETNNFSRVSRILRTNANLSTGQILVLGGLTRLQTVEADTQTPILGQIPLIGWFFRGSDHRMTKTNLAIFISPTIVNPKLTAGLDKYTRDKAQRGYNTIEEGQLFENMRDPITRWFFRPQDDEQKRMFDSYLDEVYKTHQFDIITDKRSQERDIAKENDELKRILSTENNPFEIHTENRAQKSASKPVEISPLESSNALSAASIK